MMVVGIVLFALGIMASIVLHEYGHMKVALWSGMRVRRFFVGFGPTVWSVNRGGIEYGLKAVPLGQAAGQRLLATLGQAAPGIAEAALSLPEDAWSNLTPAFALCCARHETQYSRLFRS